MESTGELGNYNNRVTKATRKGSKRQQQKGHTHTRPRAQDFYHLPEVLTVARRGSGGCLAGLGEAVQGQSDAAIFGDC